MDVVTDRQDHFISAVVIYGNPVLTPAAIESAKTWHFGPFSCDKTCIYRMRFDFRIEDTHDSSAHVIFTVTGHGDRDYPFFGLQ